MVTNPMKNSHISRESNQGSRSQKIFKKSKPCEQPKHFVDTRRTTQQGMSLLGLERKLNAIEFCGAKGSQ